MLDAKLPDVNGLEFQSDLTAAGVRIPIIFITGHADVPMSVRAMKTGAVEFPTKPFRAQELLDAIQEAAREKEVMALVVSGMLNKQIGGELDTSELTIKTHRGRVMQKMKAGSLADLVRVAERLKPSQAR